jgi:hypothetical protein
MAKVTAPLLGFGAGGTIGKTQVYSTWRGIPYARRWVTPNNPKSASQTQTRSVFSWLNAVWKQAPALVQAPWSLFATGAKFTNRNAFIQKNLPALRAGTDLSGFIGSPGAKGGLAPTSITATPGAGTITVAFVNPTPPTGWVLASAVAMAIPNKDPHSTASYAIVAAADTATHNSVPLAGLTAQEYTISAWLEWTKPDGSTAYSPSLQTTASAT